MESYSLMVVIAVPIAVIKIIPKEWEKDLYLADNPKLQSITAGKLQQRSLRRTGHIISTVKRREQWVNTLVLRYVPLLPSLLCPGREIVPPASRMALLD